MDKMLSWADQFVTFIDTNFMDLVLEKLKKAYYRKSNRNAPEKGVTNLYNRIYKIIKEAIIHTDIPAGNYLPPTRKLASEFKISRSTVIRAYELLVLEGYVESKVGSGHQVRNIHKASFAATPDNLPDYQYPELSDAGKSFLSNVNLINSTDNKSLAFRPGLPPLDIFPVNKWKNLTNLYWRYIKLSALSYSPSAGIEQLRKNIANYLNLSRNIKCDPQQVIIVSGSLQSLYLIGTSLLNAGDGVVMENPTFPNVISIFKGMRANISTVPTDQSGLIVSELESGVYRTPKLIHTTPSCHYPSGARMSIRRRTKLLNWASRKNTFIIENDYEHEVNNTRDFIPPIFSLDDEHRTIYMSTFNRLLHPAIRIGYMVVPYYLLDAVEALLKHSHRFVPPAVQIVLNRFIEKTYLSRHVNKVIETADERKKLFMDAWKQHFGDAMPISPQYSKSLHVLAELKDGKKDKDLVESLARENIIAHAYSKCFVSDPKAQGLVLGYASVRNPLINRKVEQMAQIFKKQL